MTGALVFLDTETTGLGLDDDIWEVAAIRREPDGTEARLHLFVEHSAAKCARLPEPFQSDHATRFPPPSGAVTRREAAMLVAALFTGRPHLVGAVPNFDTERLTLLLQEHGYGQGWHYHLIDVENLAVGWLHGQGRGDDPALRLPWDSDALSRACGVEPPTTGRHTAMGDVEWAMALHDAVTGRTVTP